MSLNSVIVAALTPIVPIVSADIYEGSSLEYITFNYSENPDSFGDESPEAIRYLVQVHYFLPNGQNPLTKKKQIKNALLSAGFTYPTAISASDGDTQHYIFECEYVSGDV